jgi:hypothetical protein
MKKDFHVLVGFLAQCGPAAARSQTEPGDADIARLTRFAKGQCGKSERTEICALLRQNETWMRWVVEFVKKARPAKSTRDGKSSRARRLLAD